LRDCRSWGKFGVVTNKRATAPALGLTVVASVLALILGSGTVQAKRESRRDGRIAFNHGESGADRPSQLAVMDADGKNRRDLPVYPAYGLSWSPDGRFIAYQTGRDIDMINVDGRSKARVVARNGGTPDWSPSGRTIAFARPPASDRSAIWVVDTKTHRQRVLVREGASPSWSSDGKSLAFVRGHDIWLLEVSTKAAHRLISHGRSNARLYLPRPSPDGDWIAFERILTDGAFGETSYVYIARADGTKQRRLGEGESPAWSPNGQEIAYAGRAGGFEDAVIRMRRDRSHRRVLFGQKPYCGCGSLDWAR
jgi:Tol biopolymer transport system component